MEICSLRIRIRSQNRNSVSIVNQSPITTSLDHHRQRREACAIFVYADDILIALYEDDQDHLGRAYVCKIVDRFGYGQAGAFAGEQRAALDASSSTTRHGGLTPPRPDTTRHDTTRPDPTNTTQPDKTRQQRPTIVLNDAHDPTRQTRPDPTRQGSNDQRSF